MRQALYSILKSYVTLGLHFYFRKIIIRGLENIPSGPVIFAANHQNAFMDALLIVCHIPRSTHFLARADIFKKKFARWWLTTFKMIPVYRMRDGWQSLAENQKTFEACEKIFVKNEVVALFPEGNHGSERRLRPLSKGFTRVAFESIKKNPSLEISIVPIGINYSDHSAFRGSVCIFIGKVIPARDYYDLPVPAGANQLRLELADRLKKIITHIEESQNYPEVIQKLELTNPDFLDPIETNARIVKIEKGEPFPIVSQNQIKNSWPGRIMGVFRLLFNFIPLLVWSSLERKIKDPVFITSLKFGFGIFVFPLYYFLMALILYFLFNEWIAAGWLLITFFSMLLPKK